jgi:hypothetical protein
MFHGGGHFPRDKWPIEKRWQILEELATIPWRFGVPLAFGYARKSEDEGQSNGSTTMFRHMYAYMHCIVGADAAIQDICSDENAIIVAEDSQQARRHIKFVQKNLREPNAFPKSSTGYLSAHIPIRNIVDTVNFVEKGDAALLQITDACAFILQRYLRKAKNSARFYRALTNNSPPQDHWFSSDSGGSVLGWKKQNVDSLFYFPTTKRTRED